MKIFYRVVNLTNLSVAKTPVHVGLKLFACLQKLNGVSIVFDGCRNSAEELITVSQIEKRRAISPIADVDGFLEQPVSLFD